MATHKNVKPKRTKDSNKPNMDYKTVIFWLDGRPIHSKIQSMSEKVCVWVGGAAAMRRGGIPWGLFHAWPAFGKLPKALQTNLLKAIIL
jgi:hypothetical protein